MSRPLESVNEPERRLGPFEWPLKQKFPLALSRSKGQPLAAPTVLRPPDYPEGCRQSNEHGRRLTLLIVAVNQQGDYGVSRTLPVVSRPSRRRCASAASDSGRFTSNIQFDFAGLHPRQAFFSSAQELGSSGRVVAQRRPREIQRAVPQRPLNRPTRPAHWPVRRGTCSRVGPERAGPFQTWFVPPRRR